MSIYVGNLAYSVTSEEVTTVFAEYGTVKRVQIPIDRETGRARGFGFVEMGSEEEEAAAIEALDGAEWMGRDMRVSKAKPKEDRPQGDRPQAGGNRGSWSNAGSGGGGYSRRY
ncbi:RNA-binding protein [Alkalinema sp. FACHB-956]|uniref:RNA recognition motif domain-containing protein n=1 Tax=Alkalinema sp. FACHB-956 TaxID=2692768 RepID=UPI0016835399|nr:RNA-binding protein [Alkalinema sp. FACHB-956]MBD2327613.1 RNA-binding protein [Alkalinema sp. FACHB-956]